MLKIRTANIKDLEEIVDLHIECWQQTYSNLLPVQYIDSYTAARRKRMWKNIFNAKVEHVAIAFWSSKPIGFINVGPDFESNYEGDYSLRSLYILKSYHNRGVGSSLMKFIISEISPTLSNLSLLVLDSNVRAIDFYYSQGFIDTNQRYTEQVYDVELVDMKMKKRF
ncbi:GNAT family N-acetyltransferase [Vibrio parahaemolyticus]|nr:GNAT family N-acetyltransferase [Vibrio parahaemolyticus]ELJ8844812.1 GNAT family N-acetyltransferase [Vibrio parahaemolyticus]MBE4516591.1 GNAT family N-acetyltransferase [Vibrio parahaemolyticus]